MRQAAKRDTNEPEIVNALRQVGATVRHISQPGLPDLLVGHHGQTYLMEVKTAKGKLTEPEREFFDEWEGQAAIVRSVEDAFRVLGVIA
jgi:Holliday junction resolvase